VCGHGESPELNILATARGHSQAEIPQNSPTRIPETPPPKKYPTIYIYIKREKRMYGLGDFGGVSKGGLLNGIP